MKKFSLLAGIACLFSGALLMAQETVKVEELAVSVQAGQPDTTPIIWLVAPFAAILALLVAIQLYSKMMKADEGTPLMREIAQYVREGAMAYLKRQYKVVGIVFIILALVFLILAYMGIQNPFVPIAFLTGGIFSGLCGFIGMKTATHASARTAQAASEGLNRGLQVSFRSGAVMGMCVVGFGLLDICAWYLILDKLVYTDSNMVNGLNFLGLELVHPGTTFHEKLVHITTTMITFGMGASTQALFARVGGGIYTKAADVGADLVGKVEAGIPEDDPRNPATIADNVGDNVGDVAGMGADLYESYCGSMLATAALGASVGVTLVTKGDADAAEKMLKLVLAPMVVSGIGIVLSIIGIGMVKCKEGASQKDLLKSLMIGTTGSSALILVALVFLAWMEWISWGIFGSVVSGLVAGVLIGQSTEYYTSDEYKPTRGIAEQAKMGPATTIIDGLATGMYSCGAPVIIICIGILAAFAFAGGVNDFGMGLYGIGFAAVGMLSTLGITLATDAYGPIADNAGGNAEMAGLPPEVRQRTDALDSLGNTTAATGKGFAIGSAALTALALLAATLEEAKLWIGKLAQAGKDGEFMGMTAEWVKTASITELSEKLNMSIMNPLLIVGIFIGGMMCFVFCAMTMKAVGRAAGAMVEEVRRQFREKPGILDGKERPDYARCVDISTKGAQREMIVPSLLAIIVPVVSGCILGIPGIIGLLAGAMACGFMLATMLNNAGGAWDNAKKFIEKGNFGGKKSEAHKAAVVGDTVGDPCKDTSGPSLNILIKLMSMVAIVFTPVILKVAPVVQGWLGIKL
jgi:K(+)-stimulated pyrophosphate-energized sodium pump